MKKLMVVAAAVACASAAFASGELLVKSGDTLAFLGDSITQQGQESPDGYVSLVLRSLAVEGVYVKPVKAGVSGHKSNDMLARLDRDVLSKKPKVMTLSCGVNDVWHQDWNKGVPLEDYKKNITAIFDKCAASNCQVVVLTATMFEKPEMEKFKHNVSIAPYNEWLRAEAKRRGYPVADLNADMWKAHAADPSVKLTRDGVHMRPEGNRLMARGVLRALGMAADRVAALAFVHHVAVHVADGGKPHQHADAVVVAQTPLDPVLAVEGRVDVVHRPYLLRLGPQPFLIVRHNW